jgi:hypothetical protein
MQWEVTQNKKEKTRWKIEYKKDVLLHDQHRKVYNVIY